MTNATACDLTLSKDQAPVGNQLLSQGVKRVKRQGEVSRHARILSTVSGKPSDPGETILRQVTDVVIAAPILRVDESRFTVKSFTIQSWEGVVEDICDNSFRARLFDLTNNNPEEEDTISLDDVSPDDRTLVAPGAVFYMGLAATTGSDGAVKKNMFIKFRRLPVWSETELKRAQKRADRKWSELGWGGQSQQASGR